MEEQEISLEQAFTQLDQIINDMEQSHISLEESFTKYHEGMKLLKLCNEKIEHVEKKVYMINEDGGLDEF